MNGDSKLTARAATSPVICGYCAGVTLRVVMAFWSSPVSAISRSTMTSGSIPIWNTNESGFASRLVSSAPSHSGLRTNVPPESSFHSPSSMYGPLENTARSDWSPLSWSAR